MTYVEEVGISPLDLVGILIPLVFGIYRHQCATARVPARVTTGAKPSPELATVSENNARPIPTLTCEDLAPQSAGRERVFLKICSIWALALRQEVSQERLQFGGRS